MDDLEHEVGIGRPELISMAYVLGSDYTEGVKGVGIVNATEIVSAFVKPQAKFTDDEDAKSDEEDLWGSGKAVSTHHNGSSYNRIEVPPAADERDIAAMCDRVVKGLCGFKHWVDGYAKSAVIEEMARAKGGKEEEERREDTSATAPRQQSRALVMFTIIYMYCIFELVVVTSSIIGGF